MNKGEIRLLFYIASALLGVSYITIFINRIRNDNYLKTKSKLIKNNLNNGETKLSYLVNDDRLNLYKKYNRIANISAMIALLLLIPMSIFALNGYYLVSYIAFIIAIAGFLAGFKKFVYTYHLIKENFVVAKLEKQNILIEIDDTEKEYIRKVYLKYICGILFGIICLVTAFSFILSL